MASDTLWLGDLEPLLVVRRVTTWAFSGCETPQRSLDNAGMVPGLHRLEGTAALEGEG